MKKILFLFLIFSFLTTNATYQFLENITDSAQLNADVEKPHFRFYHLSLRNESNKLTPLNHYKFPIIDSHIIEKFKKEEKKLFICFKFEKVQGVDGRSQHIYSFEDNLDLEQLFFHYEESLYLEQITMFHNGKRDEIKDVTESFSSCIVM